MPAMSRVLWEETCGMNSHPGPALRCFSACTVLLHDVTTGVCAAPAF